MPAISVLVDGNAVATVNTSGYDVVSVHVHGSKTDLEVATLEMSGGAYPESGNSTHLVWINSRELLPGQQVEILFLESGETSPPGKTIHELFPDEVEADELTDFTASAEMLSELRAKSHCRQGYTLQLRSSAGTTFAGNTAPADHGFGFNLVWNFRHPERARHSLYAFTLDELDARATMRDFIREYIAAPLAIMLKVDS